MTTPTPPGRFRKAGLFIVIALLTAVGTAGLTALLMNISTHKEEAKNPYLKLVEVSENDVDPEKWGVNWPRQYDGYRRTSEPTRTQYGGGVGSEGTIPAQKAEKDPWLTRVFAGYLFSVDYRDRRGHFFMLADQEATKRNLPGKQSGNCLHCHASIMPLYRKLGGDALPQGTEAEQIQKGLELVGAMDYWDAHNQLKNQVGAHPVSCVDCHSSQTMELRVTRPGFINGIQALAASNAPVPHLPSIETWRKGDRQRPYDPNQDGTRQEMRSFVCGQCHVEYFCGKGTTIFFPWNQGLKVEDMEKHYNGLKIKDARFKDWTHAETGMEVLKAQHPEFELWSQGIHAKSGVSCADCHMPYKREGAMKVSEHWVKSPLLMVNRSCQSCHPFSEEELKSRVTTIQDRHYQLMTRAGQAAIAMIDAIVAVRKPHDAANLAAATQQAEDLLAKDETFAKLAAANQEKKRGETIKARLQALWIAEIAKDTQLQELGELQRKAQWRLDYIAAENSMGFHAPQEMARILGESIDYSRQAEVLATKLSNAKP